jgi:hypothetical protein
MASKVIKIPQPFPVFSMQADVDYILARLTIGGTFSSRAGFFAQQTCEKFMKALNVQHDGTYTETHKLLELAAACNAYGAYFSDKGTSASSNNSTCSTKSAGMERRPISILYRRAEQLAAAAWLSR